MAFELFGFSIGKKEDERKKGEREKGRKKKKKKTG